MGIFSRRGDRQEKGGDDEAAATTPGGPWWVPARTAETEARGAAAGADPHAGRLEVALFVGEITAAPADAICTSTNPRLSLEGGTGRAVLAAGGWAIKRQAEALVAAGSPAQGRLGLPVGFVGTTTAGHLPYRVIVHCVVSDPLHRSSPEAVAQCVRGAMAAAAAAGCTSVAMPVFGAGHAGLRFETAVAAMAEALSVGAASLSTVVIAIPRPERASVAARLLEDLLG
jgi:O-acetyl-ADP-ribose deacetylase (regulator of RNase III)